jgi:hypothetical protein
MSEVIQVSPPEMEKRTVIVTRNNFMSQCFYTDKFFTMPVKKEKSDFLHVFLDFSKPYSSPDHLTPSEIADVEVSWVEIQQGRSRRCANVDEFLAELKR